MMMLAENRTCTGPMVDAKSCGLSAAVEKPVKLILYHGRFQPPHKGHLAVIRHFLRKYRHASIVISMDTRSPDERNPFSVEYRRKVFEDALSEYSNRVIITSHKCLSPTFEGCLPPTWENARQFGEVDLVIGGPDLAPEAQAFWKSRLVRVETVTRRFFNISATQVRASLAENGICSGQKEEVCTQ